MTNRKFGSMIITDEQNLSKPKTENMPLPLPPASVTLHTVFASSGPPQGSRWFFMMVLAFSQAPFGIQTIEGYEQSRVE